MLQNDFGSSGNNLAYLMECNLDKKKKKKKTNENPSAKVQYFKYLNC